MPKPPLVCLQCSVPFSGKVRRIFLSFPKFRCAACGIANIYPSPSHTRTSYQAIGSLLLFSTIVLLLTGKVPIPGLFAVAAAVALWKERALRKTATTAAIHGLLIGCTWFVTARPVLAQKHQQPRAPESASAQYAKWIAESRAVLEKRLRVFIRARQFRDAVSLKPLLEEAHLAGTRDSAVAHYNQFKQQYPDVHLAEKPEGSPEVAAFFQQKLGTPSSKDFLAVMTRAYAAIERGSGDPALIIYSELIWLPPKGVSIDSSSFEIVYDSETHATVYITEIATIPGSAGPPLTKRYVVTWLYHPPEKQWYLEEMRN